MLHDFSTGRVYEKLDEFFRGKILTDFFGNKLGGGPHSDISKTTYYKKQPLHRLDPLPFKPINALLFLFGNFVFSLHNKASCTQCK